MAINPSMLGDNDNFGAMAPQGSEVLDLSNTQNTQQTNVQGESVAPTASKAGFTPAVDPQGDTRTPFEIKQDQHRVNTQFTSTPDEADDSKYIIGERSGHRYEKVDDGLASQLLTAAIAYGTTYYSTDGDIGQAVMSSGKTMNEHLNVLHRQNQIQDMEKEGLAATDIETFIKSGDKKDLTTNKGKWINIGGGWIANENTGETKRSYNEMEQWKEKQDYSAQVKSQYEKPDIAEVKNPDGTTTMIDKRTMQPVGRTNTTGGMVDTSGDDGSGNMDNHAANSGKGTGFNPDLKPFPTMERTRGGDNPTLKTLNDTITPMKQGYNMAEQAQSEVQAAMNETDPQKRNAAIVAAGDKLARTLTGPQSTAFLSPETIQHIAGSPVKLDQVRNYLEQQTGKGNSQQALEYVMKLAEAAKGGYQGAMRNTVASNRDSLSRFTGGNPHQATGDIMTRTGVSPEMFMNPQEQQDWREKGVWTKEGGLHGGKVSNGQYQPTANQQGSGSYAIQPGYKDPDSGMTYLGGNPNSASSWK